MLQFHIHILKEYVQNELDIQLNTPFEIIIIHTRICTALPGVRRKAGATFWQCPKRQFRFERYIRCSYPIEMYGYHTKKQITTLLLL